MKKITAFLTICCAIMWQLSFAQKTTPDASVTDFVTNATVANMKEIATGKLAEKNAKDPSVKAYGGKMVDHHTMATKQLMALVKSKGYKIPKPDPSMAAPDSMLIKAKGAEFDRMYVPMMITDHQKAIQLFETASQNVSDPDIKAFAVKTLPLLKEHLAEIQQIASKLNIPSPSE